MTKIVLSCALAFVQVFAASACMTFVAGKKVSATGRVIVGHNEDDFPPLVVHHGIVPARDWPAGSVLPATRGCCATVPQAAHTLACYWSEVKFPQGDKNADVFLNEKGVLVVSDSGGRSTERKDDPTLLTEGGVQFNLRRAVGERATSARDGVRIIGELVEKYGYAPSARIYTVADRDEAWLVQVVHGRNYVAVRCPDDEITIMPNLFTVYELDAYSPGDVVVSSNLVGNALAKGFWDGTGKFNFAKAYQGSYNYGPDHAFEHPNNTGRFRQAIRLLTGREWPEGKRFPFSVKPTKTRFSVTDMEALLSAHNAPLKDGKHERETWSICAESTIESSVCEFTASPQDTILHVAFGHGCEKPYQRLRPFADPLPAEIDESATAEVRLASHVRPAQDARPGEVRVRGYVGRRIDSCFCNHLLKHDAVYLTDPYKDRTEEHYWQCEFWGKWMHSAAPFLSYTGSDTLRANITASVENLLPCQEPCGYLGNYAPAARCGVASRTSYGGWDVWCQKYTLLGLLYADECLGDKRCLDAACRHLDWLMTQVGPSFANLSAKAQSAEAEATADKSDKKDIGKTGRYHGLASLSILEPVVRLYRRTGKKEYLKFATYIVSRMDAEEGGGGLVTKALAGVDVADRTPGKDELEKFACSKKAYEMLSCYQGLLEYHLATGDKRCLDAVVATAKNVIATELNVVGGAASQELWYHGKDKQTHPYYRMNETCVVTTWLRLCESLLAVTGDPSWADELERTFYNIYLATLSRDGSVFAQYTGLEGARSAGLNNCFMEENCCNANGPRGFVAFMRALMTAEGDVASINLYETSTASVELPALKEKASFETFTLYPKENWVRIVNRTEKPLDFALRLRIPSWSEKTDVKVNGEAVKGVTAGTYCKLRRRWLPGDKVEVTFDMPCKVHLLNNHVAFTRGPVVLARDARFRDGNLVERMRAIDFEKGVEMRPVPTGDGDIWMAFAAFLPMGAHSESPDNVHPQVVRFCDFASAGNTWTDESSYRVWLPVELRPWDRPSVQ
ncbi:MAG: glycoside hydrolase family 127 protein [Kiritimatiellae bacterium]|nr:glycoside hydrolase family 127 protein [Kiritimatiellia bacterium]